MKTVKCTNCRKRTVLPESTCAHCGTDLSDAIHEQTIHAKIRQIRDVHEADWLRQPNVFSVETRKDEDGIHYIAVGVERLEGEVNVPEAIDDVPVRVELVGRIQFAKVEWGGRNGQTDHSHS